MGWYQVTKCINGRSYLYLQMTYREGAKVKTKNKYLGPANGGFGAGPANLPTASQYPKLEKPAGRIKVQKIRRLKSRTRAFINKQAAKRRFEQDALANLDELRDARCSGAPTSELKATDKMYRNAYRIIFRRRLKLRKK
jgi:hypothetical protein